ncbi:hypothetical protein QVD17_17066 [Tagetes erecta]|uniref:F-box domain-containing protein n=1 Tax=Tagetes erecta TaxID=13708 RepID=A0AAD8P139_TARER|nr:hypothetical protein QVD17_17066 [Tagetes erecta]
MSDNIPFEIQQEIIKKLPVKSLIQFRSVSKTWKSLIDSSDFIARYIGHVQHLLIRYHDPADSKPKYVSIVDDDTFPQQKLWLTAPILVNMLESCSIIGSSHGLLWEKGYSIRYGVCSETNDLKIVKIRQVSRWSKVESVTSIPWQVEVFTLRTGAWRSLNSNLPRKSIRFSRSKDFLDGFIYWLAIDRNTMDDGYTYYNLIISFDMTSERFKEVKLPDSLAHGSSYRLSLSKLKESICVFENNGVADNLTITVWMMEDGISNSFVKLFTISNSSDTPLSSIRGFRKTGEPVTGIEELENLSTSGVYRYVETLLLLDQPNH